MARTEEILNYANSFKGKGMENEELKEVIRLAIIDGAIWADTHPTAFIEKAVKFLKEWNAYRVCLEGRKDWFIEQFKNYMKGE